jgi:hypothetical protein
LSDAHIQGRYPELTEPAYRNDEALALLETASAIVEWSMRRGSTGA